jgi:hypothetical protein
LDDQASANSVLRFIQAKACTQNELIKHNARAVLTFAEAGGGAYTYHSLDAAILARQITNDATTPTCKAEAKEALKPMGAKDGSLWLFAARASQPTVCGGDSSPSARRLVKMTDFLREQRVLDDLIAAEGGKDHGLLSCPAL